MTKRSLRRLIRRMSSLAALASAAAAIAAPSALARPVDLQPQANTGGASSSEVCRGPFRCAVDASGIRRDHPYGVSKPVTPTARDTSTAVDQGFAWDDAGVGAGVTVLASGALLGAARLTARRRVPTQV